MTLPVWPNQINYLAERGSWNKVPNEPVLRSEFDSGPARSRRRFTRQVTKFSFTVEMSEIEYASFESFFQYEANSGASWFSMPVYLGRAGYESQAVRFTEPYQVKDAGFLRVKVSAKLEVKMAPLLSGGAVYFVSEYGEEAIDGINDELDPLVNIEYPEVMENY